MKSNLKTLSHLSKHLNGFFTAKNPYAWEKCKLGEVFVQTAKFVNPDEQGLELWSLTIENGLTPKTERYNREFLVKKDDKYKLVSNNEFIYNPMNLTLGAIDLNRTGKKVCVSGYYITMTAHQDKYDNSYLLAWLRSYYAIQLYKNNATGSLKEKQRVQFPTFSKISTYSPSILEQQKIGALFRRLDRLITLHKRQPYRLKIKIPA
ncbi:restriction endonuclease subunit S [Avibacterium paragallinarum]|uniref:restriction endonuclease subunit S n=1 Tax=Avibacterium paragallinarum TaxID=728 RepID=UPI00397AB10B